MKALSDYSEQVAVFGAWPAGEGKQKIGPDSTLGRA